MVTVSVERKGGALWVTVTCAPSESKRASRVAAKAAEQWVRDSKFRRAFRRATHQTYTGQGFHYRVVFALG